MTLVDALPTGALIGLDTPPLVYFVENHSQYGPMVRPLFEDRLDLGLNRAVTSVISLVEVLIRPLRMGRTDLAQAHRDLLTTTPNVTLAEITNAIAVRAAELRASLGLRLADALQVAAAIEHGATHFVTNDGGLRRVTSLHVFILDDFLPPPP